MYVSTEDLVLPHSGIGAAVASGGGEETEDKGEDNHDQPGEEEDQGGHPQRSPPVNRPVGVVESWAEPEQNER